MILPKMKRIPAVLPVLALTGILSSTVFAQATQDGSTAQDSTAQTTQAAPAKQDAADSSTYATGKPLEMQSKEGFWGHLNPLARKKWVKRQVDPVKDRVNELDQVQAKNANDIKDVDSRATAGISKANAAAMAADQHAQDAASRANAAQGTADTASNKTNALHGTVSNLDQYSSVSSTSIAFVPGHTALTKKTKAELDDVAQTLGTEKGYIIEVQGYSRSGVANSQAMADSVVRYLVTEHQVPIYRIYRTGLGNVKTAAATDGEKPLRNGVKVTLMHNSLATMDGSSTAASTGSTSGMAAPSAN